MQANPRLTPRPSHGPKYRGNVSVYRRVGVAGGYPSDGSGINRALICQDELGYVYPDCSTLSLLRPKASSTGLPWGVRR